MRRNPAVRYAALALELVGAAVVLAALSMLSLVLGLIVGGILFVVVAQLLDRGIL